MDKYINDTSHYEGALLEEMNDRLKGIQEGQASMVHVPAAIAGLQDDMAEVKSDIKVIKAVLKIHSRDIDGPKGLKARVTKLELARA